MNIESYVYVKEYAYVQGEETITGKNLISNQIQIPLGVAKGYIEKGFCNHLVSKGSCTVLWYSYYLSTMSMNQQTTLIIKDPLFEEGAKRSLQISQCISIFVGNVEQEIRATLDARLGILKIPLFQIVPALQLGDEVHIGLEVMPYHKSACYWVNQLPAVYMEQELGASKVIDAVLLNTLEILDPRLEVRCRACLPRKKYVFREENIMYAIYIKNTGTTKITIDAGGLRNIIPLKTEWLGIVEEMQEGQFVYAGGYLYNQQPFTLAPNSKGDEILAVSFMVKVKA